MVATPPTSFSWREIVTEADDDNRDLDNLYPQVYFFTNGTVKRDSGPRKGVYTPP